MELKARELRAALGRVVAGRRFIELCWVKASQCRGLATTRMGRLLLPALADRYYKIDRKFKCPTRHWTQYLISPLYQILLLDSKIVGLNLVMFLIRGGVMSGYFWPHDAQLASPLSDTKAWLNWAKTAPEMFHLKCAINNLISCGLGRVDKP